jgi:hypothetical protein
MSGHTPGPWFYCGCESGGCSCLTVSGKDAPVAVITGGVWGDDFPSIRLVGNSSLDLKAEAYMEQISYGEVPMEEAKANARLIAAAPSMLEALNEIAAWGDSYANECLAAVGTYGAFDEPAAVKTAREALVSLASPAAPADMERTPT